MEQLQKLIDEYVKWTQENRMAGKKIAVYLGLQVEQSPKHAAFYEAVGEWAKTFASSQPEHEQTVAAVRLLLFSGGWVRAVSSYCCLSSALRRRRSCERRTANCRLMDNICKSHS